MVDSEGGVGGSVLLVLGPSAGGIRRHVASLAARLEERGWRVEVAGPNGVLDGLGRRLDHAVDVSGPGRPARALRARRRLGRVVAEGGFDLVHAHGLTAGWLSRLSTRLPVVVTVHNVVAGSGPGAAVLRRLQASLPARVAAVIAVSHDVASTLGPGATGCHVIPPVAEVVAPVRDRDQVRSALGVGLRVPLVANVARLHPQKDHATFLRALVILRPWVQGLRAVLVGDGPSEAAVRRQCRDLGLDDVVVFAGRRPNPADEMAAADAVALTSHWEGDPIVVVEALSLGRPLVATAVGGVAELVEDGVTGRLVAPHEPQQVADALADLLADPLAAAALGQAGRERVAALRGPERLADDVVAVYEDVLS